MAIYTVILLVALTTTLHTGQAAPAHDEYETLAQSVCTSMAIQQNKGGWTYAVKRKCGGSTSSCSSLCISNIDLQDSQSKDKTWSTLGAIHVYYGRPVSTGSSTTTSNLGLKILWNNGYENNQGCGPNFCCCHASA